MPLFMGLDCGGSKTRCHVIDETESVVWEGRGGTGNISSLSIDEVVRSLQEATLGAPQVDSVAGCFAGLLGSVASEKAMTALSTLWLVAKKSVFPDYAATMEASPIGTDVCVIAGTGSVICSRQGSELVKSGGGGPLLGDRGSAYDVGRSALYCSCVLSPPYEASENFWILVHEIFGTRNRYDVPAAVHSHPNPVAALALLAPAIGQDYLTAQPLAKDVLEKCMFDLAMGVVQHCKEFHSNLRPLRMALAGGLWKASPSFQVVFEKQLQRIEKNVMGADLSDANGRLYHIERLTREPATGAALLAKRSVYGN